ncbi:hypothetical protein BDV23DRAFT_158549 [Aspergillus alliaceus]|uniref:Uncharacterized protein n=1 Tax=Petromyces alliaceus TaxID=209559 RepID=A0A5N7C3L9_PETAA|nr:hypothetical protein BDV23DRAFT_158549 [Aspergillus alliaceus]
MLHQGQMQAVVTCCACWHTNAVVQTNACCVTSRTLELENRRNFGILPSSDFDDVVCNVSHVVPTKVLCMHFIIVQSANWIGVYYKVYSTGYYIYRPWGIDSGWNWS